MWNNLLQICLGQINTSIWNEDVSEEEKTPLGPKLGGITYFENFCGKKHPSAEKPAVRLFV